MNISTLMDLEELADLLGYTLCDESDGETRLVLYPAPRSPEDYQAKYSVEDLLLALHDKLSDLRETVDRCSEMYQRVQQCVEEEK